MKTKPLIERLKDGMKEVIEIRAGRKKPAAIYYLDPDAKEIRELIGVSQEDFASMIGVSIHTLRGWEQGQRKPVGAAKVLLRMAGQEPETVARLAAPLHVQEVKAKRTTSAARKKPARRRKMVSA